MVVAAAPLIGGLAGMQGGMMLAGAVGVTGAGASFLGAAGYMLGSFYGGQIFAPKSDVDMPQVSQYPIQQSVQGNPIPPVYGCCRLAGNIIYLGPTQPVAVKHSAGGKGGGGESTTEIRFKKSFLIAVAEGPATIGRIWSGKTLVTSGDVTVFDGPGSNSGLSALVGEDFTDYPNLCCVWFQDWDLGNTEQIPNFVFEVNGIPRKYPTLNKLTAAEIPSAPTIPADAVPSSPIAITSRAGLEAVTAGNDYILMADIDLDGSAWSPLSGTFDGVFEGNDHTISNMTFDDDTWNGAGLFGELGTGSRIQNLHFKDCSVTGEDRVGIMAGQTDLDSSDIVIKNITCTDCEIVGENMLGMIVGRVNKSQGGVIIANCHVTGTVTGSNDGAVPSRDIGGLVGEWTCNTSDLAPSDAVDSMINCTSANHSNGAGISTTLCTSIGGLVGKLQGLITHDASLPKDQPGVINIHTCSSSMDIDSVDKSIAEGMGGCFGEIESVNITTCFATGDITNQVLTQPSESIGGFAGAYINATVIINCYCTGSITCSTGAGGDKTYGFARDIGGFMGSDTSSVAGYYSHFLRCHTTSDITVHNNSEAGNWNSSIAGFIGGSTGSGWGDAESWNYAELKTFTGFFERCWCEGTIHIDDLSLAGKVFGGGFTNSTGLGAFGGRIGNTGSVIENCYSWSRVKENDDSPHDGPGDVLGGCYGTTWDEAQYPMYMTNYYHATPRKTDGLFDTDKTTLLPTSESIVEGIIAIPENLDFYVSACFWDTTTDGVADGSNGGGTLMPAATDGAVGKPTADMQDREQYEDASWDISGVEGDTDDSIWYLADTPCHDENPSYIIRDLLTHPRYGVGLDEATWIDTASFDELYTYFADNNLLISLPINDTKPVLDWLEYICSHVAAYVYVTDGKIGLGAWRDQVGTFAITTDHLVVDDGDDALPPVQISKRDYSKTQNRIEVAWTDRPNDYNTSVAPANDFTDQRVSGKVRKGSVVGMPGITNNTLAVKTAHRILLDSMYRFNTYALTVSMNMQLIETGDVGTINDGDKIIDRKVRITAIRESANGVLRHIECVDDTGELYPLINYSSQSSQRVPEVSPTLVDAAGVAFREDPINPVVNLSITPGNANVNGYDVYRSYDDTTYEFIGRTLVGGVTSGNSNSRGTTTTVIPAVRQSMWDADQTLTVSIGTVTDLSTAISDDDFFGNRKLAKIDDEIIAYHTCVETAVEGVWTITGVIRGLYWTEPVAHAVGATFETLDNDFRYVLRPEDVGETLYFKVAPIYGRFTRDYSSVAAVSYEVQGEYLKPAPAALLSIVDREGYESITAYPVDIDIKLASKTSGWGMGGFGEVPFGNFSPDERLASVQVLLKQTDGTEITAALYSLQGYMHEGDWRLNIADADRDGNDPIDVTIKAVGDKTSGARVHRVDIA